MSARHARTEAYFRPAVTVKVLDDGTVVGVEVDWFESITDPPAVRDDGCGGALVELDYGDDRVMAASDFLDNPDMRQRILDVFLRELTR